MQQDFLSPDGGAASLLSRLVSSSDLVFVKKLSNNDRLWAATPPRGKQAGPYIFKSERDSGFFPPLLTAPAKAGRGVVREAALRTIWPQTGTELTSRLVNYKSKGEETHLTRLPKEAFSSLPPASYLVMGLRRGSPEPAYDCLTVESDSEDALLLFELLDLDGNFISGVINTGEVRRKVHDTLFDFAAQVLAAWEADELPIFAARNASLPDTASLSQMARIEYLSTHRLSSLNPFALDAPGNVLREISRVVEWRLFREFQMRARAVALVRLILGDHPRRLAIADVLRRLVDKVGDVDALMLSASQQRKSRAGYSFEHHIEHMLSVGGVPYEKQVVIEAKKRPDFVLPNLAWLRSRGGTSAKGLILSAKTTLRERWKQVQREMGVDDLYLATVDEGISASAIEDMANLGIQLVVPEDLKESRDTVYGEFPNVLDFRSFFRTEIAKARLPTWGAGTTFASIDLDGLDLTRERDTGRDTDLP